MNTRSRMKFGAIISRIKSLCQVMCALALACTWSTPIAAQAGQLDPSFGEAGILHFPAFTGNNSIEDVHTLPDGRFVLVGSVQIGSPWHMLITRRMPDGSPDLSFGEEGMLTINPLSRTWGLGMAELSNGNYAVLGRTENSAGGSWPVVVMIQPDGTLDPDVGDLGVINPIPVLMYNGNMRRIFATADGKMIIAGSDDGAIRLIKLDAQGEPVADFSFDGAVSTDLPNSFTLNDEGFQLMEDGAIMAFDRNLGNELTVIRYLPNGSLDQSFGSNGFVVHAIPELVRPIAFVHDADGVMVMAALEDSLLATHPGLVRFHADGTRDLSFGVDGVQLWPEEAGEFIATSALPDQGDWSILIAGRKTTDVGSMPVLSHRTMDLHPVEAFGDGGNSTVDLSTVFDSPVSAAFEFVEWQGSNGILAGGMVNTSAGQRGYVARFLRGTPTGIAPAPDVAHPYRAIVDPWADVVRLECPDQAPGNRHVMLFDARGALLSQQVATGPFPEAGIELPLNGLANGVHHVVVQVRSSRYAATFVIDHH